MNILSELLPGARQIRTPLAVGYLWLFVAWLNVTHLPTHLRRSVLVIRATQDAKHLNVALVILIVSFAAYLIGLFFELFDDVAVKALAVVAIVLGMLFCFISFIVFIVVLWPVTLPIGLVIVAVFYRKSRKYKTSIRAELRQWAMNVFLVLARLSLNIWRVVRRIWSPAKPIRDDFVAERLVGLLDDHPEVSERFCKTIDIGLLRVACHQAGIESAGDTTRLLDSSGIPVDMMRVARRSSIDPASEELLRGYLALKLADSREARKSVILRTMETSGARALLDRAVGNATARIQADKPDVFDTCDRLRSEGELRRGLAAPLGVALSSACSFYTGDFKLVLAAAIPAIFVYFSGMKKQEESLQIVTNFISAGITPMDLDITDARLLQWHIKDPKHPKSNPVLLGTVANFKGRLSSIRSRSGAKGTSIP